MNKKANEIHDIYVTCQKIFEPSMELFHELENISDNEEKLFYETMVYFFLKQKQKRVIDSGVI